MTHDTQILYEHMELHTDVSCKFGSNLLVISHQISDMRTFDKQRGHFYYQVQTFIQRKNEKNLNLLF